MGVESGDELYICLFDHPPRSGHYGDTGEVEVMGAVSEREDAELWSKNSDSHSYVTRTLDMVEDY